MHCIGKDVAKEIVPDDKIELFSQLSQKTILESLQSNNPLAVADTIQQYTDGLIALLPPSFASSSATTQEQGIPQQSSISLPTPLPKPQTYTSKMKNSATFATHLCITDEYRSSKTCPYCHEPTTLQKYRDEDGKLRSANGALKCTNLTCPSRSQNTFNRDAVGGFNIAVIEMTKAIESRRDTSPGAQLSPREAG
ncbi:hypothetical protein BDB00DRAFT_872624 [Zychaea mexicana]|uniref:uncharacterized protein n=1 Tax=Zychaea mexicana TaxID=64656 RepID=UPI0022FF2BC9|nr:uncharacterized protein BDB00DRAFT_872624 [Zychaea mexicana]KAI9493106.1 hypothetical protein BDB00DRAFT_872624 [Zychaea mexicana]